MHIPPYLQNEDKISSKGVDQVVVIASNDPFVMKKTRPSSWATLLSLRTTAGRLVWATGTAGGPWSLRRMALSATPRTRLRLRMSM
jgi:hypothetical protein